MGNDGIWWHCESTGQHMLRSHPADKIDHFEIAQSELWRQFDRVPNSWAHVVAITLVATLNPPQGFPYRTLNMRLQHVERIAQATTDPPSNDAINAAIRRCVL